MKKNNAKTSKVIHQLNNSLTNVNLSAEVLLQEFYGKLNVKQKKYANIILSEGKKISELIKKI